MYNNLTLLHHQIMEIKSCAVYKTKGNVTTLETYLCDENEVCCEGDSGCCPLIRTARYYESWCFWIFVFGVVLACYLLCWYCKKLEKNRQNARRVDLQNNRGSEILPSPTRGGVDRLLETLILSYRNRLANQSERVQNLDQFKGETSPPAYDEALHMPRPSEGSVAVTVSEISPNDNVPNYDEAIANSNKNNKL